MAKRIEVQIVGDASNLQRALSNATSGTSKLGGALGMLGKAAVVGFGALAAGSLFAGKKMVDLASDAAEVQSKMEVVFGKTLPKLTANLDDFSRATGASKFALREQAADMGALLTPILGTQQAGAKMSETFVKLATDLGSFNNVPVGDALEAIRSGLVGQAEPMRRFGVLINEAAVKAEAYRLGLAKVGAVLTEQEKVQARASLIMKQTALAQGDAARTAGSMANQMKALKNSVMDAATAIGAQLIPIILPVLTRFNAFLKEVFGQQSFTAKLNVVWEGIQIVVGDLWTKIVEAWQGDQAGQRTIAMDLGERVEVVGSEGLGSKLKVALGEAVRGMWADAKADAKRGWDEFWQDLFSGTGSSVTAAAFGRGISEAVTKALMAALHSSSASVNRALEEVFLDPLRTLVGSVRQIMGSFVTVFTQIIPAVGAAAGRLGLRIIRGILDALDGLIPGVTGKLNGIITALATAASNAFSAAVAIGWSVVRGVISGLGNLVSEVGSAIASKVRGAIDWAKRNVGSTAQEYAHRELGAPMGQGVIDGWIKSTATLPSKMSESLRLAIEHARKTVATARDRLGSAFDSVTDRILRAFDAESQGMETTSEKRLREMDERRQMEDLVQRQTDAQLRLNEAIASGDAAAIAAAQRDLTRATEDITRVDIEAKAAEERKNLDSLREEQRIHLEKKLAALEASFVKEGASVKKAMAAMAKLMAGFGIDFETAGALVGEAFVAGLRNALGAAASAAAGVDRAVPGASGFRAPAVAAAGGGGNVTVVFPSYVGDKQDLIETVRSGLAQVTNRGGLGID